MILLPRFPWLHSRPRLQPLVVYVIVLNGKRISTTVPGFIRILDKCLEIGSEIVSYIRRELRAVIIIRLMGHAEPGISMKAICKGYHYFNGNAFECIGVVVFLWRHQFGIVAAAALPVAYRAGVGFHPVHKTEGVKPFPV